MYCFQVPTNVQIKQQLPLKLATKLGGGSNTLPAGVGGPQQMLPLKLSSATCSDRRSIGGYQRLGSPPDPPLPLLPAPTHARTGSSPAQMQNIQVCLYTVVLSLGFIPYLFCITYFLLLLTYLFIYLLFIE